MSYELFNAKYFEGVTSLAIVILFKYVSPSLAALGVTHQAVQDESWDDRVEGGTSDHCFVYKH